MQAFKDRPLFPGSELQRVHEVLAQEGITQSQLLMGTGLPESCLSNPEVLLSWDQFDIIYRNAYRLSERPEIGLLLGSALDITRWGVLGMAMASARDVDHCLGIANHYRHIVRSPFNYLITRIQGGLLVKLARAHELDCAFPLPFITEVFLMGTHAIIEDLLGTDFHFREAGFAYPAPDYSGLYGDTLRCPASFGCSDTYYIIDDKFLRMPLPKSNPVNYRIARKLCEEKQQQIQSCRRGDIVVQIQEQLARHEGAQVSLENVADSLGVSARTVRRKLSDKGTSFRDLYNQDRKRKALDYMHNSTLDTESIATLLGFADTASFRKAFKRWMGMNPKEYQEKLNFRAAG
ncbi:MAG: AraC family transcriptional regulator ligand-binding domain-containing protein [Endozoicomonas sp.]